MKWLSAATTTPILDLNLNLLQAFATVSLSRDPTTASSSSGTGPRFSIVRLCFDL